MDVEVIDVCNHGNMQQTLGLAVKLKDTGRIPLLGLKSSIFTQLCLVHMFE